MGVPGGMFVNCGHAQQKTTQFVRRDHVHAAQAELQKRANRANQLVLFILAGANFLGKAREKLCYYVHGSYHLCHSTLS